jgi:anti-sigma-K factor RskA
MTHDELRELTGGYALGVLSDSDRAALEAHLATCAECAREVREFTGVASSLAFAAPQVDPPAALRERVLRAAVAPATPHVRPLRSEAVTVARPSALPSWLAAAAAVAAVAFGLYALSLRERVSQLEAQLRQAIARAEGVERELQIASAASDRARQIVTVLDAPDLRTIPLAGQKGAPAAAGRAHWSPSRGLVFTASNLPSPSPGRQYQLWVIPQGETRPVSAGMIDLESSGLAIALADPTVASRIGTVAVTLEVAGGVAQPTTDPVLVGTW